VAAGGTGEELKGKARVVKVLETEQVEWEDGKDSGFEREEPKVGSSNFKYRLKSYSSPNKLSGFEGYKSRATPEP